MKSRAASLVALLLLTASVVPARAEPETSPAARPDDAAEIDALIARLSVESKVSQIIMPDIGSITLDDVRAYRFGTILNGGNSGPNGNDKAPPAEWLTLANGIWDATMAPRDDGQPVIPALWATDAIHGHSNIPGATIFPHNIALGAARDADLVERIGAATAAEIAVTGIDWTFAPTLAVATDPRWGRTYESFSSYPALVARLGEAAILGLQGRPGAKDFLGDARVLATAKHFFGDGGTGGKDRGDTVGPMEALLATHASPYGPAIAAGVQTVMASFSSINGAKMHGNKPLLTDTLRGDLGFDGLVVGDWNGHGELPGCTNSDCPQSLLAGLDVYMVPEDWRALHQSLVADVRTGVVPIQRLDEAVRRVLTVKQRFGLFERSRPGERPLAGRWDLLGAPAHRDLAREAVRKSLVLLKNNGVLPIRSSATVVVAGEAAHSVARQSGGWSITWQGGGDLINADFPGATTLFDGLAAALAEGGGKAVYAADGATGTPADVAIVVFGEPPYAEYVGDREDLVFRDEEGLRLLGQFREAGVPTVAVFLSGRPLWVNREINAADAFVAAWLPGSEGAGVADVLIGDAAAKPRHDFASALPFAWPIGCATGDPGPFVLGAAWSYASPPPVATLSSDCPLLERDWSNGFRLFDRGLGNGVEARLTDAQGTAPAPNLSGQSVGGALTLAAFDRQAQEDGRRLRWTGDADLALDWPAARLPDQGRVTLRLKIDQPPMAPVRLAARCEDCGDGVDLAPLLAKAAGHGWQSIAVPLRCLAPGAPQGLVLSGSAGLVIELDRIGLEGDVVAATPAAEDACAALIKG